MSALVGTMPSALQTPAKFRVMPCIYITLLITSDVPSVVEAESTDGISVVDTAAGRYTVTFDGGGAERLVWAGGCVENPDATPTGGMQVGFTALTLDGASSSVEIQCVSATSTLVDPETLSKVRFKLELAHG